jgi:hypothetical protein
VNGWHILEALLDTGVKVVLLRDAYGYNFVQAGYRTGTTVGTCGEDLKTALVEALKEIIPEGERYMESLKREYP